MRLGARSLGECERRCCEEELCHSVVWHARPAGGGQNGSCVASLAIAHGARPADWCWHPTLASSAVTSLRLPGAWEQRAIDAAARVLRAHELVRHGPAAGPRLFRKHGGWTTPAGHTHPLERSLDAVACAADAQPAGRRAARASARLEASDMLIDAISVGDPKMPAAKRQQAVQKMGCGQ